MGGMLRIGTCQTPGLLGDIDAAVACIAAFAARDDARDLDLLLFPAGFLQGYLVEPRSVLSPAGAVVAQVPLGTTGMVTATVS